MRVLPGPLLRCAPEISLLGGQSAEQGSWANYAQERERGSGAATAFRS